MRTSPADGFNDVVVICRHGKASLSWKEPMPAAAWDAWERRWIVVRRDAYEIWRQPWGYEAAVLMEASDDDEIVP